MKKKILLSIVIFLFFASSIAATLASDKLVFFCPNIGSKDMLDLFTKPEQWTSAREKIDVFQFYRQHTIYTLSSQCPTCDENLLPNLEEVEAFLKLKKWGIDIGIEAGVVKPHACDGSGIDLQIQATKLAIQNIQSRGGIIKYISMDEPLYGGQQIVNGVSCGNSLEKSASETARFVKAIKEAYPSIIIGDIEAYPIYPPFQLSVGDLKEWLMALEENGVSPAFFHLDVQWDILGDNFAADMNELKSFLDERHIPFGIIFKEDYPHWESDKDYYDNVVPWIKKVKSDLGWLDHSIFQSWVCSLEGQCFTPINLPEDDPNIYSHTRLINEGLAILMESDATVADNVQTTFAELNEQRDGCKIDDAASTFCNTASKRLCQVKGYKSGFGPIEYTTDKAYITCIKSEAVNHVRTTFAELNEQRSGCTIDSAASTFCEVASKRLCQAKGYESGFGPVEYTTDKAYVTCIKSEVADNVQTTFAELNEQRDGCKIDDAASTFCNTASKRLCQVKGYKSGFGPIEYTTDKAYITCIKSDLGEEPKCANEGKFCGGIAGTMCCSGLDCMLEGTYPDAGGRCVKKADKCTDTDGGKDYYVKGTCTDSGGAYGVDECIDATNLTEMYCTSNPTCFSETYSCPYGCKDGACITEDHCNNGIQDRDEEDVDCGGSCPPCIIEICNKDGACELHLGEDSDNCPEDCWCGDGLCDNGESAKDCPEDCRYCMPEWKCKLEPAICPPEGIQNKVCYDTKCGTGEKRVEAIKCEPGSCEGCPSDGTCYPIMSRMLRDGTPSYCDITKTFEKQKSLGEQCQNNYECKSNECSDGECISLKKELEETKSLLRKILEWIKNIFE